MRLPAALIAAAASFLVVLPLSAPTSVAAFVGTVNAVRADGPLGLLTPNFQVVRGVALVAANELRAERAERAEAGLPPIACVPHGRAIDLRETFAGLAALPGWAQALPLRDGLAMVLARRYPCR